MTQGIIAQSGKLPGGNSSTKAIKGRQSESGFSGLLLNSMKVSESNEASKSVGSKVHTIVQGNKYSHKINSASQMKDRKLTDPSRSKMNSTKSDERVTDKNSKDFNKVREKKTRSTARASRTNDLQAFIQGIESVEDINALVIEGNMITSTDADQTDDDGLLSGVLNNVLSENLSVAKLDIVHGNIADAADISIAANDLSGTDLQIKNTSLADSEKSLAESSGINQAATNELIEEDISAINMANDFMNPVTADKNISGEVNGEDSAEIAVSNQLEKRLAMVKEAVMKALELAENEFDQLLTEQGLSLSDLTNQDALKQFILAANGEQDIITFLLDGNMADKLKEITDLVTSITEAADKELSKELQSNQAKDNIQNSNSKLGLGTYDNLETNKLHSTTADEQAAKSQNEGHESKDYTSYRQDFNAFLDEISNSFLQETSSEQGLGTTTISELREIANQIVERIKVIIKPEQTSMELNLKPEHLGRVTLNVLSKEGIMSAHFTVESEIAKEAIEGQLVTLKETLENQGIKVDVIEVTVDSYASPQSGNNSSSQNEDYTPESKKHASHKITLEEAQAMEASLDIEKGTIDTHLSNGHIFDYKA